MPRITKEAHRREVGSTTSSLLGPRARRSAFRLAVAAVWSLGCASPLGPPEARAAAPATTPSPRAHEPLIAELDAPRARAERQSSATWCVGAGAPMLGEPIVDRLGRVYVGTTDGYVHSFESDGRYRWSYTVSGAVVGRLALRPADDAVLVGTTRQLVYAITSGGQLNWKFRTITPVMTGLAPGGSDLVLFAGADQYVYALSTRGAARWRAPLGGFADADPLMTRDGVVWVAVGDSLLRVERSWRTRRLALPAEAVGAPLAFEGGVVVIAGNSVLGFDSEGQRLFSHPDVRFVASGTSTLVAVGIDGRVFTLDRTGETRALAVLGAAPSAPPAVGSDAAYVPLVTGELATVSLNEPGRPAARFVASSALGRPVLDPPRRQLLIETATSQICAVPLSP